MMRGVLNMIESNGMTFYALSFFFGIIAASLLAPALGIICAGLLLSAVLTFINRRYFLNTKASILLFALLAGMLDYRLAAVAESKLDEFEGRTAVYECVIIDAPRDRGTYVQYTAECRSAAYAGKLYNFREKVFLRIKSGSFSFGDKIKLEGICENISAARNPGDFDYRNYYKSKGIRKTIKANSAALSGKNAAGTVARSLYISREKVSNVICKALPPEEASILVGIITGDKSEIDEETRTDYMRTGLSHILSVSGLHVGFLMILITGLLKPLRLRQKTEAAVVLAAILYYILLIGAPLPSVRAFIMLSVLMLGKLAGREYNLLSSVSFAALLILVFKPLSVHDPGFVISFASMYSIAFLYQPVYKALRIIPEVLRSLLALSLAVWLGLAPVLIYYFNYISFVSILINLAAVPLAFIITVTGFIGVAVGVFSNIGALYVLSVDYYFIRLLSFIIHYASSFKLSGAYIPVLPLHFHALYYSAIIVFAASSEFPYIKIYKKRFIAAHVLLLVVSILVYNLPGRELKVIFFDVGQGDSSCIITPDKKAVLVDGGGSSRSSDYYYDVGGKITLPALLHQGIWELDTVIVSHFHDDHMEGLLKVLEVYDVNNLIIPKVSTDDQSMSPSREALLDLCRKKGTGVYALGRGDSIKLGSSVRLDFFMPDNTVSQQYKKDENNNSLVGRLSYGNFSVLYTGDIGKAVEAGMPAKYIGSAVLKVPHHGSNNSSGESFLKAVSPKVSVISVGKNNFGHPSPETIERLNGAGSTVYRTDEAGAVTITTDGRSMKIRTVK